MEAVIVIESPNKIKKVRKFSGFEVMATVGHFKDLPSSSLGVDLHTFEPTFEVKKKDVVKNLKSKCKGKTVYIATDPDREGYAIGMDVYKEIKKIATKCYRTEISEITQTGIKKALQESIPFEKSNTKFYDSFLARRIIDRLTGYCLSPEASKLIGEKGYSVGRVQSPAVKIIVEREREIRNFVSKPFWEVIAKIEHNGITFDAISNAGKMDNKHSAESILQSIEAASSAEVTNVEQEKKRQKPPAPFTTSELQISANKTLGLSPEKVMGCAQQLFEAGLITYHRTDSTRIADEYITELRTLISEDYPSCLPESPQNYKSKNSQAEAHEAIRPTEVYSRAEIVDKISGEGLSAIHEKLLNLIWERTVASQMASAEFLKTKLNLDIAGEIFNSNGSVLLQAGFLELTGKERKDSMLPDLQKGDMPAKIGQKIKEGSTKPPSRYNLGTLVKKLEILKIGRPSTYASITKLIQDRGYVQISKKHLVPTAKGENLIDHLNAQRPWVIEYNLTQQMEAALDQVAEGGLKWASIVAAYHKLMGNINPEDFKPKLKVITKCPRKGCSGNIVEREKLYGCSEYSKGCKVSIFKSAYGTEITERMAKDLFENGTYDEEVILKSSKGTDYSGFLYLDKHKLKVRSID